jgi:guanylate kinase
LRRLRRGKFVVLDGPSSAGKSTIATELLRDKALDLQFVKRYTTRPPRPGDEVEGNYIFISMERFRQMEERGEFAEVRHFEFGISYGLPLSGVDEVLASGSNAMAIISLGNAERIRQHYPDCIAILITAPLDDIHERLQARGMEEEKIAERLINATDATKFAKYYNYTVNNKTGHLTEVVTDLKRAIGRYLEDD